MITRLPPLNAIKAFHVACRHLNLSRAAEELGVTQGAVSKQILSLEQHIGTKLFERIPTGLELTLEGLTLKRITLPAFDLLLAGFSDFERRPIKSRKIRISTLISFAAYVLAPRIGRIEEAFPDIQLEIFTSDRLLDHTLEEIDFAVRYGRGEAADLICQPLGPSALIPVCHPEFSLELGPKRLIQVFFANEWTLWARENGDALVRDRQPVFVEDLSVALNAALCLQGLALLPELLVRDLIARKQLVAIAEPIRNWEYQYHLAMLPQAAKRKRIMSIIDWLKNDLAGAASV